jgi:hypothetical protein
MSGIGAEWLRALGEEIPDPVRLLRARRRTRRRRRLTLQRVASWVATHSLDAKPPTRMHKNLQDLRRADDRYFVEELLPMLMDQAPPTDAAIERLLQLGGGG